MSIRSMTGFGRGSAAVAGLRAEVGVSSVNRKQLDVVVSLGRALSLLEPRVQEAVGAVLTRGRVTVDVVVSETGARKAGAVRVDESLAKGYVDAIRAAARKLRLPDTLNASSLLGLPGVVRLDLDSDNADRAWPAVEKALRAALAQLVRMRAREGAALAVDLLQRVDRMDGLVAEIRAHAPAAAERYRKNLRERVRGAMEDVTIPAERIDREVILFAERSDITEELTRLASHAAQARSLVRGKDPAGRALDFLAQEMSREINTIGSKANDAEIARRVVLFKTELDRFREQVQNIE